MTRSASGNRAAGAFASNRSIVVPTSDGSAFRRAVIGTGVSVKVLLHTALRVGPVNGGSPVGR